MPETAAVSSVSRDEAATILFLEVREDIREGTKRLRQIMGTAMGLGCGEAELETGACVLMYIRMLGGSLHR